MEQKLFSFACKFISTIVSYSAESVHIFVHAKIKAFSFSLSKSWFLEGRNRNRDEQQANKQTRQAVDEHKQWKKDGREPRSSGYGRRLMFKRLWVQIQVLYTGWTWHFLQWFYVKIVSFVWTRPKINAKRGRGWPIFLKKHERKSVKE